MGERGIILKKITLKLNEVISIWEKLNNLLDKEMSAKLSFKLSKILNTLSKEIMAYEVSRKKLIERFAKKNSEGQVIFNENNQAVFEPMNAQKFNDEYLQLIDVDIKVSYDPISLSEFNDIKLTINEMSALQNFIKDD